MAAKARRGAGLQIVIFLFLCWSYAPPCSGFKRDPRSQFYGHALVQPTIYTETRQKRDIYIRSTKVRNEEKLTLGFVAFDKNFVVELYMNKELLPEHYFEKHYEEGGKHVIYQPTQEERNHCHYQGHLQGFNHSWAAISTCAGISGVIYDGEELHYIEPDRTSDNSSHFVFKASDIKPQNLKCGVSDLENLPIRAQVLDELQRHRRSTVLQDPYKSNSKSRFVELIIVNDNKEFKEFNQSKKAVFERSKQIANIVNGLYSPLNIFIALVGVIVWSDHDEITLSTDGDATLTNFLHYRRERLAQEHPNDNAQLITAMTFNGGVVGKALKGPICTYQYSGGVNMDHSHVVGLVATTVAHELGHNFGMEHDTDECQCPDDKCIMAPSSSSTSPRHWSSCSLEYLELAYSQGMDYCLKNRPLAVIGPVCGNGFLEDGESCDCGLKEFCDNHCCNATSCQLFQNASCAMGGCCDIGTCQMKKEATHCRAAVSECDLPEFCDGISEFCPANTYRQNGEECGGGKAYCFDGKCSSHAEQCKLLWGQTGKMSDVRCFEQNLKGNVNGNCGYKRINQTYKACSKQDVLCGMLHCTHLNERLEFGMESAAILARSFINVRGKIFTCRSAIVDLGLFSTDPGLAPNGAKCGDRKACVNQNCVSVDSIKRTECPFYCSGNGVCNNNGNCHCVKGYGPPYCNVPGPGGSIDSGPASDTNGYLLVVAMYVIFLGLLPLIVLSAAAIYYFRSHLKIWWITKARKAAIKSRAKQTAQRKAQPPSKFNFDRNSLRTLEISAPLQQVVAPTTTIAGSSMSTLPRRARKGLLERASFRQVEISSPIPQSSTNNTLQSSRPISLPVRPAPPRPEAVPQRTPSWTPATAVVLPTVLRTSSLRTPADGSVVGRPNSMSTSRPNCPPPRPPPPKANSPIPPQHGVVHSTYEDLTNTANDAERSATPSSTYYDDCQTLDFSDTPLAFVHLPSQSEEENVNPHSHHTSKLGTDTVQEAASLIPNKLNDKTNFKCNSGSSPLSKPVFPSAVRTGQTSLVASLTQKFENQKNTSYSETANVSLMRPPFKSRPLPPRPYPKV